MADTCVKQRHCGASYPGWLSGGHPSVSDGAVLRKVCFTGYWGCCHYSTFISVRNCGGFFVYKLSPVHRYYYCHFRYCLSNGFELPTTSTAVPSAPPMNVSGYNTSSTSISVHWDQVPDAYQNGALLYYTVTYRSLPSGFRQTVVVAAPAHQTTLTGLKIYTNYSITVFASTYKGAGNVSAPFFIVTDEDRPSGYPVNVRGNTISSTSIFVQWDEVPAARQNGVILYYTITYRPYSVFCLVNVFAPKTQITLTGLNESTIYWISVSASTIKGHGPARHISIATACARQQKILNARNGKIIFSSYYYRYNQTCSWKIVANKREQVKLVLESVHFRWCGLSCSCGHLEIQDGTYADGFTTIRICIHLLGNTTIYSHVGHGLRIQAVTHASWWNSFKASYTVISHKDNESDEL
ncbi:receptor-type tyrosine-protein phosphatase F-like [Acropora palmata]|uniref:receptor-type tyrosine-protein phosphatase F-like n=1 Tax=Acropora palmata TaxID=6131 RepID=UPI003DA194FB